MKKFVLFLMVVCFFQTGICQNKKDQEVSIVSHTVQMGETVRMISRKYLVDPSEIYKLNKFAVDGISHGQVLQIPVPVKEPVYQQEETIAPEVPEPQSQQEKPSSEMKNGVTTIDHELQSEHTVVNGETLYSLSRIYNISVDEIKMSNGDALNKGLKVGQIVKIPGTKIISNEASSIGSAVTPSASVNVENRDKPITEVSSDASEIISHKVVHKETLYSLSKKYNVTVDEITAQNPELAQHGLQVGEILKIRINK